MRSAVLSSSPEEEPEIPLMELPALGALAWWIPPLAFAAMAREFRFARRDDDTGFFTLFPKLLVTRSIKRVVRELHREVKIEVSTVIRLLTRVPQQQQLNHQ